MSLSVDFVLRQRVHTLMQNDFNLFNRAKSRGGPVIRACDAAESVEPAAQCSNGPIEVIQSSGRDSYRALLVRLDIVFSDAPSVSAPRRHQADGADDARNVPTVVISQARILRHFHFPFSTCHFSFAIARVVPITQNGSTGEPNAYISTATLLEVKVLLDEPQKVAALINARVTVNIQP